MQPSRLETGGGAGGEVACGLFLRKAATASPVHHFGSMACLSCPSDDQDPPISMGSVHMRGERPRRREHVGMLRGRQQCCWGLNIRPALAHAAPCPPTPPSRNPGRTSASQTARLPTSSARGGGAQRAISPPPRRAPPKRSRLPSAPLPPPQACCKPGSLELIPQASSPWPKPSQLRRRAAARTPASMCSAPPRLGCGGCCAGGIPCRLQPLRDGDQP